MARERWDKRQAFIMAAIGSAIGLGNVIRFPYQLAQNGGASFLIPYVVALITTGIPLLALEIYFGIRFQKGPTEALGKVRKNTNFIGWFAVLAGAAMITFYYTVLMGWSVNYMAKSVQGLFSGALPWSENSRRFFFNEILKFKETPFSFGALNIGSVIGNLVVWSAVFLVLLKGVKVVGKIVNWTVGIPWIIIIVLIIRGITLEGSGAGLEYYLHFDYHQILEPRVWLAAYGQVFFSLSLGFGVIIAYASYMPKDSDINANAWVISFANCATSFFAGFAIFSTLGYMAAVQGVPVADVAGDPGIGLAFVAYPSAIASLPGGIVTQALFAIAFFFMIFMLGVDTAFSLVETIVTGLKDTFGGKRVKITATVCVVGFLFGFIYCFQNGLIWLDIVDHWMSWGLMGVGLMEAVLIGWFYNTKKVIVDIDSTSGIKFGTFWIICIKYVTPIILILTFIVNFVNEFNKPYEGYNTVALLIGGWGLLITLFFIALLLQKRGDLKNPGKLLGYAIAIAGFVFSANYYYAHNNALGTVFLIVAIAIGVVTGKYVKSKEIEEVMS